MRGGIRGLGMKVHFSSLQQELKSPDVMNCEDKVTSMRHVLVKDGQTLKGLTNLERDLKSSLLCI